MLCQHFCFGQILYGMFWAWERSGFALSFSGLNNRAVSQCYVLKVYLFLNNETELWLYINGFRIFISGLCYCLYNLKQQSYSSCWAQWKPIWPISVSAEPHHLTLKSTPQCAIPASPGRTGGAATPPLECCGGGEPTGSTTPTRLTSQETKIVDFRTLLHQNRPGQIELCRSRIRWIFPLLNPSSLSPAILKHTRLLYRT
jgi:hypothetical protein